MYTHLLAQGTESPLVLRQSHIGESQRLTQDQINVGAQLLAEWKDFLGSLWTVGGIGVFLTVRGELRQTIQCAIHQLKERALRSYCFGTRFFAVKMHEALQAPANAVQEVLMTYLLSED